MTQCKLLTNNEYQLGKGCVTDWFQSQQWRVVLCESGSAEYQFDDGKLNINTGDIYVLDPSYRRIVANPKTDFRISLIFFDINSKTVKGVNSFLYPSEQENIRMLREMHREITLNYDHGHHEDLLNAMITILIRDRELPLAGDVKVRKAIALLKEDISKRWDGAEMAEEVCLSRSHFYVLFKQNTGKNFAEYQREYRLRYALTLMQELNYSIKQTATEIGATSLQSFSREFKKYFGYSPRSYLEK